MTYNVGALFAVVGGLSMGRFLFGFRQPSRRRTATAAAGGYTPLLGGASGSSGLLASGASDPAELCCPR